MLTVAGVSAHELAAEFGTPMYVVDEDDFRAACPSLPRRVRRRATSTTPARRSCPWRRVRWIAEEGLGLDVCTGGELAVALAAGFDPARIGFHGNNKSDASSSVRSRSASAGSSSTPTSRSSGLAAIAAERGVRQPVLLRVTAGVEAHTHEYIATAHEDQKFGFSIAEGEALAAMQAIAATAVARPRRSALAHRLADLRHLRLRGRGAAGARACTPQGSAPG